MPDVGDGAARTARTGSTRAAVRDLVRRTGAGLSADEVADELGLHRSTARFHLDGLVESGDLERLPDRAEPGRRGRPRVRYVAAAAPRVERNYGLLAEMLGGMVSRYVPDPRAAALETGRSWGAYLVDRPAPGDRVPAPQARERLVALLDEVGFAPEPGPARSAGSAPSAGAAEPARGAIDRPGDEAAAEVRLRHCPFREVVERHGDVVCAMHLGLMQGALAELGGALVADRLDPLVEPDLCVGHLAATA